MLKDSSFYKSSPLGDEAATKGQGAGVVTHGITGKTYFVTWSMDVKFEGENVDRHTDMTTSNHASPMSNGPVLQANVAGSASSGSQNPAQCPCCNGPLHDNQKDANIVTEEEWYGVDDKTKNKYEDELKDAMRGNPKDRAGRVRAAKKKLRSLESRKSLLKEARDKKCPHVPDPPNAGCGTYFAQEDENNTTAARAEFERPGGGRDQFVANYNATNPSTPIAAGDQINHRTPIAAGGCPVSPPNLAVHRDMPAVCQRNDNRMSRFAHNEAQVAWLQKGGW